MDSCFRRLNPWVELHRRTCFQTGLRAVICLALAILVAVPVFAQTAARIEGTITDPSGAVVPGAKIVALNQKTRIAREATSNQQGLFAIPAVQPGIYTITAEAKGFATSALTNVEVNVAGIVNADFKLTVGQTTATVEVAANAVAVQTTDSQVSRAVTLKDIDTLPSLGRNPIILATFQPGVQLNPGDVTFSRVNGQRQGSNNSTLDGIDVNDSVVPRLGLSLTSNNTDSVGEFRIVTQGGKAEYGRNAGGQVEMITRSGTNSYHGNAFDYLRNTVLNANDYFNNQSGNPRPKFIQNTFGGSFGGPIFHDKTFIFGNYQGRRTRQETIRNRTIFTDSAKQGLFKYKDAAGVTQTYSIVANDPRGIGIPPQMAAIIAMLPTSNNCDVGDGLNTCGFRFNNPSNSYEDQFTIRGDHSITTNNKVFLRWSWQRNSSIDALNSADATYPGQVPGTQGGHRWGYSVGDDWTLTPTLVNEFRFGHQSAGVDFLRPARLHGPTIITNLLNPDPIASNYAQGRNSPVNDIIDNMTKIWNKHIFKWGGKYSHTSQQGYNDAGIWQNVTTAVANKNVPTVPTVLSGISSAQQTTYQQLYNDLLGRMDQITETFYSNDFQTFQAPGVTKQRNHLLTEQGYYFQDDWRALRNLTLNLGLRWEVSLPPTEERDIMGALTNPAAVTPTNKATDLTVRRGGWYNPDYNNFAPRVGFAWDVTGDNKTAVRGNYGIFYDRTIGATVSTADNNTPGFSQNSSQFPQTFTASSIAANNCGSAAVLDVRVGDCIPLPAVPAAPALTLPVTNRTTTIALFNPNLRSGYVHSYSLNVQRELIRNTILEVGYVGTRGVKLFMIRDFDQMRIDEDFLGAFKQLQAFQANNAVLPPTSNTLVTLFTPVVASTTKSFSYAPNIGQPCSAQPNPLLCASNVAISNLGASNFTNGNVGAAANTLDRSNNNLYAAAGLPQTYLRNYPQFNRVWFGGNDGRSYYDALQISVRRYAGALRVNANYTFSKSIDNISVDGNGFTNVIDNFNIARNRALGDADHRHSFNASLIYALPFGSGLRFGGSMPKWLDKIVGGWEIGSLVIVQDGSLFTVNSQRTTRHLSGTDTTNTATTWANYSGDRNIGGLNYQSDGSVLWFTPAEVANFSFPAAGEYGTSGRNAFRGPGYFDVDTSLVKRFKITESQTVTFRAEAYNLLNKPNFTNPTVNMNSLSSFGKLGGTTGPAGTSARNLQLTLRYDF